MTGTTWRRTILGVAGGLTATGLLLGVPLAGEDRGENTLIVWASDKAHIAPDFLAVLDFDRDSRNYGKVLRTIPLEGASAFGNEPHHVGLSRDGRTALACSSRSTAQARSRCSTSRVRTARSC